MVKTEFRGWEYAKKGDYHKNLDPDWSYTPTYLKKMYHMRKFLDSLPKEKTRILDAGCGEGVLVEEYLNKGYTIQGIDLNYESEIVVKGNILDMPFDDNSFDIVLLLDVFEHIDFIDQLKALKEIQRVLKRGGSLLTSIPNLAHLNSRVMFFIHGNFQRTDCENNHPGERPIRENIKLLQESGFGIEKIIGVTLTLPIIYNRIICRKPSWFLWLHNLLDFFAIPSLAMLNIYICKNSDS